MLDFSNTHLFDHVTIPKYEADISVISYVRKSGDFSQVKADVHLVAISVLSED
jgi:hypothetical protein